MVESAYIVRSSFAVSTNQVQQTAALLWIYTQIKSKDANNYIMEVNKNESGKDGQDALYPELIAYTLFCIAFTFQSDIVVDGNRYTRIVYSSVLAHVLDLNLYDVNKRSIFRDSFSD